MSGTRSQFARSSRASGKRRGVSLGSMGHAFRPSRQIATGAVPTYSLRPILASPNRRPRACPASTTPSSSAPSRRPGRLATPSRRRPAARRAPRSRRRSRRSTRGRSGSPSGRPTGAWRVNQWAKKAVLLGFRLQDMGPQAGGPQGGGWWDKVDSKFQGWTEHDWRAAGFRAVPTRGGAALGLHRAGGDPDAVLRQPRRLCRRGDDGRHLGDGRLLRADRPARASLGRRRHRRRAGADAGRADDHRGQLLHRGAVARWSRA